MWAHVSPTGEVDSVLHQPPPTLVLEDGSVVLGAGGLPPADLAEHGWYPVTDEGPAYNAAVESWDGQPPALVLKGSVVRASYAVRKLDTEEMVDRDVVAFLAAQAAELAELGPDAPAEEVEALQAAQAGAEAVERRRLGKVKRSAEPVQLAPFLSTPAPPD